MEILVVKRYKDYINIKKDITEKLKNSSKYVVTYILNAVNTFRIIMHEAKTNTS